MAIKYNGKTYKLRVKPGPDGLRDFQTQVRKLLGFDITDEFNVTFQCSVPETGERMMLSGLSSYGAATHCAAIAAAQRGSVGSRKSSSRRRSELSHHQSHIVDSDNSAVLRQSIAAAPISQAPSAAGAQQQQEQQSTRPEMASGLPTVDQSLPHVRVPAAAAASPAEECLASGSPGAHSSMSLTRLAVLSSASMISSCPSSSSSSGAVLPECLVSGVASAAPDAAVALDDSRTSRPSGLLQRALVKLHRFLGASTAQQ